MKKIVWTGRLGNYSRKAIRFSTRRDREKALHLVWHDPELVGLPRDHADGDTLVVPSQSVPLFRKKGIKFRVYKVKNQR
ncbi:MAG: hypothetical protein A3H57_02340 [Candidatus Taylorbacteria bacterium RIFCSPLOWO2_02_FULL_43_11]|uniref:Prephenate dehydratase n=1 Tax=Candidatus Taylorbacteria bacterium RIFCSPHIGHO2_02_FULL_43_32b TaxID=1802306 RepID=A0A1G2MHC8_9BACT|nr:MAG: hypothetical protein A2743_03660 [Candidatus Taylorbacteria bacterium RIFCSPHIGHO2_01_FULL_43_47]OHA23330.1 MAG: hypothetical protein A3C72_00555 [Candidatus Taylorbacteria bacterium RIFCSPHIGHO2_02_FULL_43_32b]OHA36899.1 MAG: hypothetical protein A3H57_02340 [Candidatus Taylorbacteria bacterium RIFCSPLOWO2_02_FULL_43_11]